MKIGVARLLTSIAIVASIFARAHAQSPSDLHALSRSASFYASSERFGYTGTVAVYNTLRDAQQEKHPRFVKQMFPQRDGSFFVVRNAPSYFADSDAFLTNWYDDAASDDGGNGNPNNTDFGFIQLYDGLNGAPTTVIQNVAYWDKDLDTFTAEASGANATYDATFARLWNAGYPDVGGEGTKGTWITYAYGLRAHDLHGVDLGGGFIVNSANASRYDGFFSGIFLNQSVTSPDSNGYYVVHLRFNNTSWAASNGYALDDQFGSNVVRRDDHDGDRDHGR